MCTTKMFIFFGLLDGFQCWRVEESGFIRRIRDCTVNKTVKHHRVYPGLYAK